MTDETLLIGKATRDLAKKTGYLIRKGTPIAIAQKTIDSLARRRPRDYLIDMSVLVDAIGSAEGVWIRRDGDDHAIIAFAWRREESLACLKARCELRDDAVLVEAFAWTLPFEI